jgi:hypothetical protein
MAMHLNLNDKREAYATISIHGLPKGTEIKIYEMPPLSKNTKDIKIGTITISIFEEEE